MSVAHNMRIGINFGEDCIMVDTINIDMKPAKQWKGSSLLRAMIVAGVSGHRRAGIGSDRCRTHEGYGKQA